MRVFYLLLAQKNWGTSPLPSNEILNEKGGLIFAFDGCILRVSSLENQG